MKSTAVARGKVLNWKVELGGPAAIFFVVLILGFRLVPPAPDTFDMTVFVHGTKGRHDIVLKIVLKSEGEVMIDLDGNRRIEKIGKKGDAYFPGIPAKFLNRQVPVSVNAPGIKHAAQHIKLNKEIYVEVEKLPPSDFDTTIFLHGSKHQHDVILKNKGKLTVYLGNSYETKEIGERGEAYFTIPEEFKDQEVPIALDAENFELVNPAKQYRLTGENIYAEIKRSVTTTVSTTTTTIPVSTTTTTTVAKKTYKVDLIIPNDMIGAEIWVDGSPAKIYKKTFSIIIIIVEEKDSPHEITIKKGNDSCTATQMINEDNLQIMPCQDRYMGNSSQFIKPRHQCRG